MFIELSEALACPACGPPQGLVVVVDRLDGRRVLDGFLGCPICEGRFPIRGGVIDLAPGSGAESEVDETDAPGREDEIVANALEDTPAFEPEQAAVLIAALFDVTDGRGYLLLDERLGSLAPRLAELTGGCEVIALAAAAPYTEGAGDPPPDLPPGANAVAGAGERFPVQTGRLRALAVADPAPLRLRDAVRALGPEGRLVVLRPTADVRARIDELPVQPLADEELAFLGVVTSAG